MRFLAFFLLLILYSSVFAEVIDGPANLRVAPNGKIAVRLNDGVQVYVEKTTIDWYKITFIAYVSKINFRIINTKNNVELFDYLGKSIGKTLIPISKYSYFEMGDQVGLIITLFTFKSNIVESSVLESEIVKLQDSKSLNRNSIVNLKYLKIEKWIDIEGFHGAIVMEPLMGGPVPPGIRFILFFQDQEVAAIVGNEKFNDYDLICIGKKKLEELRLYIYYLNENAYFRKEDFEKSLNEVLSRIY